MPVGGEAVERTGRGGPRSPATPEAAAPGFARRSTPGRRWPPASHSVPRPPSTPFRRAALYYRFVHTLGSPGNSPEMLDAAEPESQGLVYGPLQAFCRRKALTQPHDADV